jgi:predicted RNA-binding protein with RPS1 domain
VGDVVEAMIINVDRKTRGINLSIKAKDNAEQHEAMQKLSAEVFRCCFRHDQPGRPAEGQAQPARLIRQKHDQIRAHRPVGGTFSAAGGEGC